MSVRFMQEIDEIAGTCYVGTGTVEERPSAEGGAEDCPPAHITQICNYLIFKS